MIVCVCNVLSEANCRKTACRPECRTVGCVYRLLGARVRCGRCIPHMTTLLAEAKASGGGGTTGLGTATAAPER